MYRLCKWRHIHCVRKIFYRQVLFCNISYKTRAIVVKFSTYSVVSRIKKFATKSYKCFPAHLWNLKCSSRTFYNCVVRYRNSRIYPTSTAASKFASFESSWFMWEILQERCTKYTSVICSYRRRHWRMAAAMTTWSSLAHSVLRRCFSSSRSVIRILYTFSCNRPPHAVINWILIWRIWRPQLRWDKFWSFFFWQRSCSTCVMSISSFTR